jgi:tripartite-type tricarboxylate transporter receptor subunit TctC
MLGKTLVAAALAAMAYAGGEAEAQTASANPGLAWPQKAVRIVVPFPASTPPDLLARIAAQKLADPLGKPVIVENRPGAAGVIGVDQVVRAAPDGHTLLLTPDFPIVIVPTLSKTPYDPRSDLAPIAAVAQSMAALVVHPSARIGSIRELIAAAKANPGALTFASAGDGSPSHMCIELIKKETGIEVTHVPYKGASPAIQAVLAGEVSMYCGPLFQALPHVKSGRLTALGVTGAKPSPAFPELAPLSAQGLPSVVISYWFGVFAPSRTPPPILKRLRESLQKVFDDSEVRGQLAGVGLDPCWIEADALAAAIGSDLEKWTRVVKTVGIKAE